MCNEGGETFSREEDLVVHRRNYPVGETKLHFKCDGCGKEFRLKFALNQHIRKCMSQCGHAVGSNESYVKMTETQNGVKPQEHAEKAKASNSNSTAQNNAACKRSSLTAYHRTVDSDKQLHCDQCKEGFLQKISLKQHNGERSYVCIECSKTFTDKDPGEEPLSSGVCGEAFIGKSTFVQHQRVHSGEQCDKSFNEKNHLVQNQRIHKGVKVRVCTECDRTFTNKNSFAYHQRIHTGENPFVCTVCNKAFKLESGLSRHRRIHTGEKPFVCTLCGMAFNLKCNLVEHTRRHTGDKPFACTVCGKAFIRKNELVQHQRTHTGEKPFICAECGKAFSAKNYLRTHKLIHTGEKRFVCIECGKAYRAKGRLLKHLRTHITKE